MLSVKVYDFRSILESITQLALEQLSTSLICCLIARKISRYLSIFVSLIELLMTILRLIEVKIISLNA